MSNERDYIVLRYRDKNDLTAGFDYVGTIESTRGEDAVDAAVRRENFRLGEVAEHDGMYVPIAVSNFIPMETGVTQEVNVKVQAKPLASKTREREIPSS